MHRHLRDSDAISWEKWERIYNIRREISLPVFVDGVVVELESFNPSLSELLKMSMAEQMLARPAPTLVTGDQDLNFLPGTGLCSAAF